MAKFCTRCGRPLVEGQVCVCMQDAAQSMPQEPVRQPAPVQGVPQQPMQQAAPVQGVPQQPVQQAAPGQGMPQQPYPQAGYPYQQPPRPAYTVPPQVRQAKDMTVNVFHEILYLLKSPDQAARSIAQKNSVSFGLITMGIKALVTVIIFLILSGTVLGAAGKYIGFPGVLLILFLTFGCDMLHSCLLVWFSKPFGGRTTYQQMMTVVGTRAVYDTIFILLFALFLPFASPVSTFLLFTGVGVTSILEYNGFKSMVAFSEDRKIYALMLAKIVIIAVFWLIVAIGTFGMLMGAVSSLASSLSSGLSGLGGLGGLGSLGGLY